MPTLNWIGKDKVINYDNEVPDLYWEKIRLAISKNTLQFQKTSRIYQGKLQFFICDTFMA